MVLSLKITYCLLCLVIVTTQAKQILNAETKESSLLNFVLRTKDISKANPERSLSCFNVYVPILNKITSEYEETYGACLKTAVELKSNVDNSTLGERVYMAESADYACNLMVSCTQLTETIEYFECFVNVGNQNSKNMYGISTNASTILAKIREKYRIIEYNENLCTNASERVYVEDTARTYEQLQGCLQGLNLAPETSDSRESSFEEHNESDIKDYNSMPEKLDESSSNMDMPGRFVFDELNYYNKKRIS